jgi:hypothetical protein
MAKRQRDFNRRTSPNSRHDIEGFGLFGIPSTSISAAEIIFPARSMGRKMVVLQENRVEVF